MQSSRLSPMRCPILRPNSTRFPQQSRCRQLLQLRPVRRLRDERGSVTIEAAFALAELIIVTSLIIGAIATVSAHISAIDAASAAARAHAIGVDYQPPNSAEISVQEAAGLVTVTAEVPAVFGTRSASAVYPVETR